MASAIFPAIAGLPALQSPTRFCCKNQAVPSLKPSRFLSPVKLKTELLLQPTLQFKTIRNRAPVVRSAQSNFLKVVQTAFKVGRDGIEAGTNLVPDSIPRPVARISVTVVGFTVGLFLLKSFISTALFALATMGLIYFTFIALNKNDSPKSNFSEGTGAGPTSVDDSLEEARRIMEKYK